MREEEKVADAAERRNLTQFSSFKNKKKWKERHVHEKNKFWWPFWLWNTKKSFCLDTKKRTNQMMRFFRFRVSVEKWFGFFVSPDGRNAHLCLSRILHYHLALNGRIWILEWIMKMRLWRGGRHNNSWSTCSFNKRRIISDYELDEKQSAFIIAHNNSDDIDINRSLAFALVVIARKR